MVNSEVVYLVGPLTNLVNIASNIRRGFRFSYATGKQAGIFLCSHAHLFVSASISLLIRMAVSFLFPKTLLTLKIQKTI